MSEKKLMWIVIALIIVFIIIDQTFFDGSLSRCDDWPGGCDAGLSY